LIGDHWPRRERRAPLALDIMVMHTSLNCSLVAFAATFALSGFASGSAIPSAGFDASFNPAQGGSSSIRVLGQEENYVVIVVQSQESKLCTLRVTDGTEIEDSRVPPQTEHTHKYYLEERGAPLSLRPLQISLVDENEVELASTFVTAVEPWALPGEPCLTLTPAEILDLQKRWPRDRRTGYELDKLKTRADNRLLRAVDVPAEGGAWTQLYRCPDTQVYLNMINFNLHVSPATGKQYSGQPYDQCITTYRHRYIGEQAYEMALTYVLTEEDKYGQRAREILVEYAQRYQHYDYHDRNNLPNKGGGKAFPLSLDEAEWLVDLASAYDLLQGSGLLSDAEQQQITNGLLLPAIEVVALNDLGVHNIQVWHNAALFLAGLHAKDYPRARNALLGPSGLETQLAQGVNADGMWWENSPGYHFNTIRGMLPMIHGVMRTPIQVDISPLERMLVTAFELKLPDHTLPLLNDGAREGFQSGLRDEYEQVVGLFPNSSRLDDPIAIFGRGRSLSAVLYGPADIRREGWNDITSLVLPDSGLAVLRSGPYWQRTMAMMDFGTHGGGHGHYDKLGLTLWMQGAEGIREAGSDGYGNAVSEVFFPSTLAHSTVVINGLNQEEAEGNLGYFSMDEGASTVTASVDGAYLGVQQRRLLHTTEEGHFADMFEVESDVAHTIDYVIHGQGVASTSLAMLPSSFGYGGSYAFLCDVESADVDGAFEITFENDGKISTLLVLGEPGTTVFLARAPGYPMGSKHPVVVVRRNSARTVFAAAMTEGPAMVPGFSLQLVDDGDEPLLLLTRPSESGLRSLSFIPEVEN